MPEFFLELFSEEIPARMQAGAAQELVRQTNLLIAQLGGTDTTTTFFGPRRIALGAEVAAATQAGKLEARGPRASAPEAALAGFLKKHGADLADIVVEDGYYLLRRALPPVSAGQLIREMLPAALQRFSWPKSMRWGQSGDFTWVRPLRRIVCLLDGQVIPVQLGPVTAAGESEGHRFLAKGPFSVRSVADWQAKLEKHYVIADADDRLRKIVDGLNAKAGALGLTIAEDDDLLDEVTGLVEWPVALIGKIGAEFMDLPPEVRELSMKVNQKYFALRDADGKPAPYFAFVSNIEAPDGGATIIAGNERVLRARLSDARHFWDLDLEKPLVELLEKLDKITFHAKIGTQGERVKRISKLAGEIAQYLAASGKECKQARDAGLLCKADLVTGMVGEFPELQGVMGGYYYAAQNSGNPNDAKVIGDAIKTPYQPKGPSDAVPTGTVAVSVALADKLDTLIKFFENNEKPSGSGDPYALRRAALGVIRIILENNLDLRLKLLIGEDNDLFAFIIERLRVKLRGEGKRFDVLDAVIGAKFEDDLASIMERVNAVSKFLSTPDGANLLVAYRRAANILRIEEAKDGRHAYNDTLEPPRLPEAEKLRNTLEKISSFIREYDQGEYGPILEFLAQLRAPVDAFFDNVTVNDPVPELRHSHLHLLAELRKTMHLIADFSKIEG
jgi:glycyl-tRNA synthetase beta chain